jgi:two-component system phosphate regulon sensor histidine kinase PhoR
VKAGTIASVGLWALLTVMVGLTISATLWLEPLVKLPPVSRVLVGTGVVAIVAALVVVPLGVTMDRAAGRLRGYIEDAAEQDTGSSFRGPRWLRGVSGAVQGALDQLRQREQALRNQLRDLEVRHRVAEAERRQMMAVLNSLRDGVLVTDPFNEIQMANEAAAELLGFDLERALHKPIDNVLADERVVQLIMNTRDAGHFRERRHVEHEVAHAAPASGPAAAARTTAFDICLACVENLNHEVGGVVTIFHDLTRERELSQMKSDFVSKASHELRTPLSSIRAYVEMLVDGEAGEEQARQEFYRIIQDETDRLGRLIDNMLNISRIEAGIVQIERENVEMSALVDRALETLEPQAREKEISLHRKLAPVDLRVEGDADMLYQVILNLVSNALKYTPDGGRVTVSADSDNLTRSVVVTVADTGLGIAPDMLPRLFEKFFRVENYKRVAKGTGLGLSLCKHIVETLHYGQIGVESKLGMGSRFWFSIPMRYAGAQAAA